MPSNSKGRGVLPINAAQTKKPFKQQPRPPAPRLRLVVRRLPPGLTEAEFWEYIGVEWQVGKGKVDWAAFKPGKISRDLAKPSRPARAYLKVKEPSFLDQLSVHIKSTAFQDGKNTTRDACLIGPPLLEFAPYSKIPNSRVRHDGRQGTIDQDPEFIDFLQSLTEPIVKPASNGESTDVKSEKVTTTPLVQYLKEKKANKAKEKEATASKGIKKSQEGKEAKDKDVKDGKSGKDGKEGKPASSKSEQATIVKKGSTSEVEKARVAKATQQAMDSIKKSVAEIKGQNTSKQEQKHQEKKETTPTAPTPKKERQRGDASAAARIIGRDLGLVPKENRRQRAVTTPASAPAATSPTPTEAPVLPVSPSPQTAAATDVSQSSTAQSAAQPPTGPRNLRTTTPQPSSLRSNPPPQASKAKAPPQPSPGAKSAFLKHANPSQGVTEELLRSIFSTHGTITRCEIDKKKGLGYIDFAETEALKKAMAASPVKVGNGSVVVLENRTPYRKVSQAATKNNSSPKTSTPSSPQVTQAALASIPEQRQPQPSTQIQQGTVISSIPETENLTIEDVRPGPIDTVTTPAMTDKLPSIGTLDMPPISPIIQEPLSPVTAQNTPPSAPRGAGRNQRGHYRGRGYRGRGGHFRGGNRAASSPNPATSNGSSQSAPNASAEGKS